MKKIIYLVCVLLLLPVAVNAEPFEEWKSSFKERAMSRGIQSQWFDNYMAGIVPIKRVIELDGKQPEGRLTFIEYKNNVITNGRIKKGRALYKHHYRELKEIEKKYGVEPQFVIALWGIETSYGANTGGFMVIPSLASLAWDGRRRDFFEKELIYALTIIADGHITLDKMNGSWAGAMGQNQFMPSSFLRYAVDYDGDGKRDIWGTKLDVFASTSNYLKNNGWKTGEKWGTPVYLSRGIPEELLGYKVVRPISFWRDQGVETFMKDAIGDPNEMASIIQLDGKDGPAYIVYNNYKTIMDWNRSTYFATSVGLLADLIAKK